VQTIDELKTNCAQQGRIEWIGVSPERRAAIRSAAEMLLEAGTGLLDDHHARGGKSNRQVTLIQHEHLPVVASLLGRESVMPESLRRNLVVSGINVLALKDQQFRVGGAVLEGTGHCHPCSRMEETLGPGGYNAMRGHGGITARVIQGDLVRLGDPVALEA
jgi:MOSC domain-containing protein YiiM